MKKKRNEIDELMGFNPLKIDDEIISLQKAKSKDWMKRKYHD